MSWEQARARAVVDPRTAYHELAAATVGAFTPEQTARIVAAIEECHQCLIAHRLDDYRRARAELGAYLDTLRPPAPITITAPPARDPEQIALL